MKAYTPTTIPSSLTTLVNLHLRPNLVCYIEENRDDFLPLFASPEAFEQAVAAINNADAPCGELEVKALLALVNGIPYKHEPPKYWQNKKQFLHLLDAGKKP